jgi:hypothetical protein
MTFFGADLLTAVTTAILAILAMATAWYARKAFRAQSDQLQIQSRQLKDDQDTRRRAQAARVFITIDGGEPRNDQVALKATAHNTSKVPVYDLRVQWRTADGEFGLPSVAPLLLPESTCPFEASWTEEAGLQRLRVSLDFRDAAGVIWRTTGHGNLEELCGVTSPHLTRDRCTCAPRHDGIHSWQKAAPETSLVGRRTADLLAADHPG